MTTLDCTSLRQMGSIICTRSDSVFNEFNEQKIKGFLQKKGHISWNRRYCILKGKNLVYFQKLESKQPKGVILLPSAQLIFEQVENNLEFRVKTNSRTHLFRAVNIDEKNKWIGALKNAIELEYGIIGANNQMVEGYIKKYGTKDKKLIYYASQELSEPKGSIYLPTARLHQEQSQSGSNAEFQLETVERSHFFQARNKEHKDLWMSSIRAVGQFKSRTKVKIINGTNIGKIGTIQEGKNRMDSGGNYGVDVQMENGDIVGFWVSPKDLQLLEDNK